MSLPFKLNDTHYSTLDIEDLDFGDPDSDYSVWEKRKQFKIKLRGVWHTVRKSSLDRDSLETLNQYIMPD